MLTFEKDHRCRPRSKMGWQKVASVAFYTPATISQEVLWLYKNIRLLLTAFLTEHSVCRSTVRKKFKSVIFYWFSAVDRCKKVCNQRWYIQIFPIFFKICLHIQYMACARGPNVIKALNREIKQHSKAFILHGFGFWPVTAV